MKARLNFKRAFIFTLKRQIVRNIPITRNPFGIQVVFNMRLHVVIFAFKITFDLLLMGVLFALVMGVLGGLLPAVRAAVRPVAVALREL